MVFGTYPSSEFFIDYDDALKFAKKLNIERIGLKEAIEGNTTNFIGYKPSKSQLKKAIRNVILIRNGNHFAKSKKIKKSIKEHEKASYEVDGLKPDLTDNHIRRLIDLFTKVYIDFRYNKISVWHLFNISKIYSESSYPPFAFGRSVMINNPKLNTSFTAIRFGEHLIKIPYAIFASRVERIAFTNGKFDAKKLEKNLKEYIALLSYLFMMINFIHPFYDYNGRSSRTLILFYSLSARIKAPYFVMPYEKDPKKIAVYRGIYLTKIGNAHKAFDDKVRDLLANVYENGCWANNLEALFDAFLSYTYYFPPDELFEFTKYFFDRIIAAYKLIRRR